MKLVASRTANRRPWTIATCAGAALLVTLLIGGSPLAIREAMATTAVSSAVQAADAQLTACGNSSGPKLYNCVADVISNLCYNVGCAQIPNTLTALDAAVSRLRRAVDKIQALSALSQARIVVAGALRQAGSTGRPEGGSADIADFQAISALLSHAAQLIQSKG
jgi:hypothetical protein